MINAPLQAVELGELSPASATFRRHSAYSYDDDYRYTSPHFAHSFLPFLQIFDFPSYCLRTS